MDIFLLFKKVFNMDHYGFLNRYAKIRESNEPIGFDNLIYHFKCSRIAPVSFFKFKGPMHIFKSIHNDDTTLENIEKEQIELKRNIAHIKQGNPKKDQKNNKNNS